MVQRVLVRHNMQESVKHMRFRCKVSGWHLLSSFQERSVATLFQICLIPQMKKTAKKHKKKKKGMQRMGQSEEQLESQWDKMLKIKTTGRDDSHADAFCYPYEPTPYCVLERLANSGLIQKKQTVLDYGTGKGRVCFFLSYQTRCHSVGIEYDERIFAGAEQNIENAVSGARTQFVLANAENYEVPSNVSFCYFFNPFSVEILKRVVARILESYYENPRPIQLMFYYPSDEYVSFLMTQDELMFSDEIDCRDLFDGNDSREKILVFDVG